MKKFITTKINKQQWRVTVPNLNTSFFRKSPSLKDEDKSDKGSKRSSGFYDLQEAQLEYDKSRSLPNSVYLDTSSSEDEEEFEDARAMSDRSSNNLNKENSDTDMDLYVDVETSQVAKLESKSIDQNNSKFEYDVPRISFKFFDKDKENSAQDDEKGERQDEQPNYEPVNVKVVKSEVQIVLSSPDEVEEEALSTKSDEPKSHPSEKFVSQTEIFVRSLENLPLVIKSAGSDPNIVLRDHNDDDFDDGYYKVPRSLKKTHRLSQSLHEFDMENMENVPGITSSHNSSIEHISASQVLVETLPQDREPSEERQDSENMDYCKVRSRLPIRLKRPSLLKKPKKAVATWNNLRSKFNNMMLEHAAQQRVGAFSDREKVSINFEEMYKNSKTKCKRVLQNTGKIFKSSSKKSQDSFDSEWGGTNSEPVVHVVLPERIPLKASDIEYKLNISADSDIVENGKCPSDECRLNDSKLSNGSTVSPEESKKDEFDFTQIKSAFKKKLSLTEVRYIFEWFCMQ